MLLPAIVGLKSLYPRVKTSEKTGRALLLELRLAILIR